MDKQKVEMTWTNPYCGIQHLKESIKCGPIQQITLTDRGLFVEVCAIRRGTFSSMWEEILPTVADAQVAGERYLKRVTS